MNSESSKTVVFVGVAVVLTAAAFFTRPAPPAATETQIVGQPLFPKFSDPAKVNSFKVVQFDQKRGKQLVLEVAKVNHLWVIPSHSNYPADADTHLGDASNSLIGLTVLGLAPGFSNGSPALDPEALRKAYNDYGVVDPDPADSVKSTDTGVGTRIAMSDVNGGELAAAIIGKAVPDQQNQCYLREPGKDKVYIVALDSSKLSVNFTDWIERNLLNLNSMDLKQARIINSDVAGRLNQRTGEVAVVQVINSDFSLDLPSGDQPWKLVKELDLDKATRKMVESKLAADEELNTANLDALKSALEDLKIVDVERKPSQVPADLRVGKLDNDTADALQMRGFFLAADSDDPNAPVSIYSKSGELYLQLNDGARYILRFGLTKGESSAAEAAKRGKDAVKLDTTPGMDRYLFVMADFNQDAIPKPVVEQLPPEEKPAAKSDEKKTDEKKTDAKDAKAGDAKKDDVKKDEVKKDDAKKDEPKKPADAKAGDANKADAAKTDAKKEEPKKETPAETAEKAKLRKAEQERINVENQRRQDEYNSKVAAGKKHADELNKRFAQWYYVIPGDVYEKIHLDRKAIVKKKEPPKDAHDHDHGLDHGPDLPTGPAGALNKVPDVEKK
jgi:hypothetical protein